ncbi:uncharacterized protein SCHCODRAFT_02046169 [Schizophyllum commune H4-8]|uniref:uncharacterized protein n=1 Tax=Schizophyllum commune (strain H4-8 / FGSC 9210) TaxID=578458 RepID=UPI00215E2AD0|nr:uncharacterized protein SCHCODRAFT_02046169 [Schizophyllum commune H4-8]KAI5888121.1 hypothetical protein SCHCODRAFT_02046169 [Schizophyllum commune H4-8]
MRMVKEEDKPCHLLRTRGRCAHLQTRLTAASASKSPACQQLSPSSRSHPTFGCLSKSCARQWVRIYLLLRFVVSRCEVATFAVSRCGASLRRQSMRSRLPSQVGGGFASFAVCAESPPSQPGRWRSLRSQSVGAGSTPLQSVDAYLFASSQSVDAEFASFAVSRCGGRLLRSSRCGPPFASQPGEAESTPSQSVDAEPP